MNLASFAFPVAASFPRTRVSRASTPKCARSTAGAPAKRASSSRDREGAVGSSNMLGREDRSLTVAAPNALSRSCRDLGLPNRFRKVRVASTISRRVVLPTPRSLFNEKMENRRRSSTVRMLLRSSALVARVHNSSSCIVVSNVASSRSSRSRVSSA